MSFLAPTQKLWRLFGSSRLARYIDKPAAPSQCDKCWDFHARHSCDRRPSCKRCGKSHPHDSNCTAPTQCANCLGPHTADSTECPARPIRSHGVYRRLTQEEKNRVRKMGEQLFAQRTRQTEQTEPGVQRIPRPQEAPPSLPEQVQPQDAGTLARHSSDAPPPSSSQQADGQEPERREPTPQCESVQSALSPAVTMSPPGIRVVTTPQPDSDDETPRSPLKRKRFNRVSPSTSSL